MLTVRESCKSLRIGRSRDVDSILEGKPANRTMVRKIMMTIVVQKAHRKDLLLQCSTVLLHCI